MVACQVYNLRNISCLLSNSIVVDLVKFVSLAFKPVRSCHRSIHIVSVSGYRLLFEIELHTMLEKHVQRTITLNINKIYAFMYHSTP
jgi:hypothetical protein